MARWRAFSRKNKEDFSTTYYLCLDNFYSAAQICEVLLPRDEEQKNTNAAATIYTTLKLYVLSILPLSLIF